MSRAGGEDHEYFTYRPLSNLPTPPPTSTHSPEWTRSHDALGDGEALLPKYLGPAIHLVNLIPTSSSLTAPSVPLAQAILTRSSLPLETIALAVCILDSLDSKFARSWRSSCPLTRPPLVPPSPVPTASPSYFPPLDQPARPDLVLLHHQQHIDAVKPELIVLAALVIAVKFVEDPQEPAGFYTSAWGRGTWTREQLNATERCIMENLGYRILPLCEEGVLADAMVDMQLAARESPWCRSGAGGAWERAAREVTPESMSDVEVETAAATAGASVRLGGEAVVGPGMQPTPVDTRMALDE